MSEASGPTPPSERILNLDVLRGFALLGILVINVQLFSMPELTLLNPTIYGDLTGANYWAWLLSHIFFEGKFITLFTFLFGAGVVLFTRSAEEKSRSARSLYIRRSAWLVVFGLGHAYLLWYGDILFSYGVCAFVVVGLRDRSVRTLLVFGALLYAVPSTIEILSGLTSGAAAIGDTWRPAESVIRAEIETYRGGWLAQMDHRIPSSFQRQTAGLIGYTGWRVSGAMLFGMALFKSGVLTNDRSSGFYARLIAVGGVVGIGIVAAGVAYIQAADWSAGAALFWRQFNYWGALPLAAAYVGLIARYCRWRPAGIETKALSAVGRTAFSNYLLQTLLATSVFYGHGLGLFGSVTRVKALAIAVAIWAVQIPLSALWLRYFRFGPMEWVWRVLTYGRFQKIKNGW
ncbi:MAG: hypothetical protein ACI9TI_002258 [Natronomonas sp.]|jgi:uncharacterized protein